MIARHPRIFAAIVTTILTIATIVGTLLYIRYERNKKPPEFVGSLEESTDLTIRLNNGKFFDLAIANQAGELLYTDGFSIWQYEHLDVALSSYPDSVTFHSTAELRWNEKGGVVEQAFLDTENTYITVHSEEMYLNASIESFMQRHSYWKHAEIPKDMKPSKKPRYDDITGFEYKDGNIVSDEKPDTMVDDYKTIAYGIGTEYQQIFRRYMTMEDAKTQLIDTVGVLHGGITSYGGKGKYFWVEGNGHYGIIRQDNLNTVMFYYASPKFVKHAFASCYGLDEEEEESSNDNI